METLGHVTVEAEHANASILRIPGTFQCRVELHPGRCFPVHPIVGTVLMRMIECQEIQLGFAATCAFTTVRVHRLGTQTIAIALTARHISIRMRARIVAHLLSRLVTLLAFKRRPSRAHVLRALFTARRTIAMLRLFWHKL